MYRIISRAGTGSSDFFSESDRTRVSKTASGTITFCNLLDTGMDQISGSGKNFPPYNIVKGTGIQVPEFKTGEVFPRSIIYIYIYMKILSDGKMRPSSRTKFILWNIRQFLRVCPCAAWITGKVPYPPVPVRYRWPTRTRSVLFNVRCKIISVLDSNWLQRMGEPWWCRRWTAPEAWGGSPGVDAPPSPTADPHSSSRA